MQKHSDQSVNQQSKELADAAKKNVRKKHSSKARVITDPRVAEFALQSLAEELMRAYKREKYFILLLLMMLVVAFSGWFRDLPEPKYFASDNKTGQITEVTPLAVPLFNTTEMRLWGEACVIDLLELSHVKSMVKINDVMERCLNDTARIEYLTWLTIGESEKTLRNKLPVDSQLGQILLKKMSFTASPLVAGKLKPIDPVVREEQQRARWELQLPLVLKKESGKEGTGAARMNVRVNLIRTNDISKPRGVVVDSWSISEGARNVD